MIFQATLDPASEIQLGIVSQSSITCPVGESKRDWGLSEGEETILYIKSHHKGRKEQWLDTKLNFVCSITKQDVLVCPQGLQLTDVSAAEM